MTILTLQDKEAKLRSVLKDLGSVIVAYSGGVDSSLLAYYAKVVLKDHAKIVIAISPSLAQEELEAARKQASLFNFSLREIETQETKNPIYQANDPQRCYICKKTLFTELTALAKALNIKHIAYGANMDDMQDFRPGHKAAYEYQVVSPLQVAGLNKEEIRQLAKLANLPSWDRPAAACLASRFPTWQPVTHEGLTMVEHAEEYLHKLGFRQVRVRHHGDLARIEIGLAELDKLNTELMKEVALHLKKLGFAYVTLDLEGYRQGSANRVEFKSTLKGNNRR